MNAKEIIKQAKELDKEYLFFNKIVEDPKVYGEGTLSGTAISVKDCVVVKGVESRAGSKILENYIPLFDATVIEKIKAEGGMIIGKTAQDAFGFGSFATNVGIGMKVPLNPFDKERSCGGSSGGSAGITQKATFNHISIAESTGGSIVCPASFCGVVGICPTYGRVSRYGLMDYANSLDKIGAMAKTIEEIALIMRIIAGHDPRDSTSLDKPVPNYSESIKKPIKGMKIGMIKEAFGEGLDKEVKDNVKQAIKRLESQGAKVEEVSLPLTSKYALECYYLIAMAEASTNLAKYCGMRYGAEEKVEGSFNEYFSKVRSQYFNAESKRRIIIGTFARMAGYRDAYYLKAMKVRTKIIEEYKKVFKKFDALICPTMPVIAPKFTEIEKLTPMQNYMMDILTVGPNLAGLPHITIPSGTKDKMPIGTMLIGDHLAEDKLMQIGAKLKAN
ncbi:MAG: aspartyl/glutamyl-tRNA amidotransferase subunit A [Nanoarchaeota archaeon]|nr:aspartyl/glutamyl-tRNA amidotransferase subunit A [Nanoarchaeota archaeon]